MSKLKQLEEESRSGWSDLPEVISDEIFLRLPGNSILSSRCVCKQFYNLLSKPSFIKNHLNRTKHNNPKLLFRHTTRDYGRMIYSIGIDKLPSPEFDGSVMINYPSETKKNVRELHLLGSCNGLVCLKFSRIDDIGDQGMRCIVETEYFCILNPLTKEFKEFTRPDEIYGDVTYGFGYDSNTDDYKLVIISDNGGCFKINIYTLRKDSWSSIQGDVRFSFRSCTGCYGVSFNGCLHWLGRIETQETSSKVIFSFHISNEIVVNMPFPENIRPPRNFSGFVYKNVVMWGDCIGIACIYGSVQVDVWVMQEYGEKESWIKKYTITKLPLSQRKIPFWRPLWCFDNGEILLDNNREPLHLYNPRTTEGRQVVVRGIDMDNSRESYVESIVSIGSGTYLKKPITDGVVKNSRPDG